MGDTPYAVFGSEVDEEAKRQMDAAIRLPIAVSGALMPDAHVGYGLPIGGVLATDNTVIPYGVGVDIACRMMMTVYDVPSQAIALDHARYRETIERCTRFGVGAEWRERKEHPVMEEDWNLSAVTREVKEKAHRQLGTSGSGNHFVEIVELTVGAADFGVPPGTYVALLSHSGSRGAGAAVAAHYTRVAKRRHPELAGHAANLAWLDLDDEGAEYWAAMELMGRYASANHHLIHDAVTRMLGHAVLTQVENHHNFAWRERHGGRTVVVHRKGATPAGKGTLGIIPGSMAAPGYVVRGLGNPSSLASASHGAGRVMSRTAARQQFTWRETKEELSRKGVDLISAGLDEVPRAYKDIDTVMAAQKSLALPVASFFPRIVKMAPGGKRPED